MTDHSRPYIVETQADQLNATAGSILGFLANWGPMSGYDVVCNVEASIGHFWSMTRSAVYKELARLAEAGLVEEGQGGPRGRRPYVITEAGRWAFAEWLRTDPGDDQIRLPLLIKVFFESHLDEPTLRRFVAGRRPHHQAELEYLRGIVARFADEEPFLAHVARLGVGYSELMLAWLDSIPWRETAAKTDTSRNPSRGMTRRSKRVQKPGDAH